MVDLSGLWPHQIKTFNFGKDLPSFIDGSATGCVDCDTEFLTPVGWKKISEYKEGDLVAQFHPSTMEIDFEYPLNYISMQSGPMIYFNPARGTNMLLSGIHRVLFYTKSTESVEQAHRGWRVLSATEFAEKPLFRKIAASFVFNPTCSISLSDEQLRVQVAIIADGYFPNKTNRCIIRLKKERKKERLRLLLSEAGIEHKEFIYNEKIKGYTAFSFLAPFRDKYYDAKYWSASAKQLELIADECLYWDGNCEDTFFTTIKESADFIQFTMSASGYVASVQTCVRKPGDRVRPVEYNVLRRNEKSMFVGGMRPESISLKRPRDGKQYCFTTKTSFWLARREGYIFATGNSGKSIANAKIAEYFLENGGSRVLITCPKSLVRSAWQEEFINRLPGISVALAEAPEDNRLAAFNSKADVVIINHSYDAFRWMAKNEGFLKKRMGKRALMINDESTAFKNPNSQTTKAAFKIASLFEKRHCLSGTLTPNSVVELWAQVKLVDDGQRLGKRYTAFRNLMQKAVPQGPFTKWIDKPGSADIAYGLIRDILIRHSFEEVMTHVPRMDHRVINYYLPKKHRKIYEQLEKDLHLEFSGKSISVVNAASLASKLLQCASGAIYNDPDKEDKSWSIIDSGRYELIADLVEEREHTIVFFLWKHQKYELIKQFESRGFSYDVIDGDITSGEKRADIVKNMQDGNLKVLLMHPKSGAHGLTLTKATTVIFASPTYQADWYVQGSARIRRGVQDKITESIVIIAKDTRDDIAFQIFTGKRDKLDLLNNLFERGTHGNN